MQTSSNVIDKNWKDLIKPNKLDISSNEDKTVAKVAAVHLSHRSGLFPPNLTAFNEHLNVAAIHFAFYFMVAP